MTLIMKIYATCAVLGGLSAFALFYARRIGYFQERAETLGREAPAMLDSVILMESIGLSVLFIPIGAAIGLGVGAVIHIALGAVKEYRRKRPWSE